MNKATITTVDLNAPNHSCGSCGDTVNPTIGEPSMCHRCSETWHERRRFAERMNTELAVENERHRRHIKDMFSSRMRVTRTLVMRPAYVTGLLSMTTSWAGCSTTSTSWQDRRSERRTNNVVRQRRPTNVSYGRPTM
jgi:hypothetical protein